MMNGYLISFRYEEWCQGWDNTYGYVLVYAHTYEDAVRKLKNTGRYHNPRSFKNHTIGEQDGV